MVGRGKLHAWWSPGSGLRRHKTCFFVALLSVMTAAPFALAQQAGSIRGVVYDDDFDVPLANATVRINETGQEATTSGQGNYVLTGVQPGEYTLVITKQGYARQVESGVTVSPGQVTDDVDARLTGDFTEMQEVVVRELRLDAGSEQALLQLRTESPQLLDSIGEDLMSRAGAGDAAEGLELVSGATTTAEGFAAVRGLPPRFVSTQLNGFVLPSANPDSRAVKLSLFPSDIIESIQVSKTFTPDQQGDASGGAVNIVTKSIPEQTFLTFSSKVEHNSQRPGGSEFLIDGRGDVPYFGDDTARQLSKELVGLSNATQIPAERRPLSATEFGTPAPQYGDAPHQYAWDVSGGVRHEFGPDVRLGGLFTYFWSQDISHDDERINDQYVAVANELDKGLLPATSTGTRFDVSEQTLKSFSFDDDVLTSLFDETQSSHEITWGGLGSVGLESEHHQLDLMYFFTRATSSTVTVAEDTRGKLRKFPGHDPSKAVTPGGVDDEGDGFFFDLDDDFRSFAPFRRLETQQYIQRTVHSVQLDGEHSPPWFEDDLGFDGVFKLLPPVFDWHLGWSKSRREEPGTTIFDSKFVPPRTPSADGNQVFVDTGLPDLGAYNVVFRDIVEDSKEYRLNFSQPFEQWSGDEGEIKFGVFDNRTIREFEQNTFRGGATGSDPPGGPDEASTNTAIELAQPFDGVRLSRAFADPEQFQDLFSSPTANRPGQLEPSPVDFSVEGQQQIDAWYWMVDAPVTSFFRVIGGARFEDTRLDTTLTPDAESDGIFIDAKELQDAEERTGQEILFGRSNQEFLEGVGISPDAEIDQSDILPSLTLVLSPIEGLDLRGAYSETVARPTFRELSPVSQPLFAGATPFVGNPLLEMSSVENYDLRMDYRPEAGSLLSVSYFEKDVKKPIQVIQQAQGSASLRIPVNFPEGSITGWEFEARQDLGNWFPVLEGLRIGGNATLLDTQVTLRDFEAERLASAGAPQKTIEMTNAPEELYNAFITYDAKDIGTQLSLFYTFRGDTLVASPGVDLIAGNAAFVIPAVYEKSHGTLNFTINQKIGDHINLSFSAENLTNPEVETVFRSDFVPGGDVVKTSSSKGIEYSFGISASFKF